MEEYPPVVNNESTNPKPNRLHALAFLKVGLFEFFFAAVVLFLLFGTLNYFNILSISGVFPNQLGWLPRQQTQTKTASQGETLQPQNFSAVPKISPTPTFLSNPLVARAKTIGYNIIWMDPEDTVGRTVFYDERGKSSYGGIGIVEKKNLNEKKYTHYINGIFQNLTNIPNSKDKYLQLLGPNTKETLPIIRVIFRENANITSITGQSTILLPTYLQVENLEILSIENPLWIEVIGPIYKLADEDLAKILKSGDSITAALKLEENTQLNLKDEKNNFIAVSLFIRRMGGKQIVEDELRE